MNKAHFPWRLPAIVAAIAFVVGIPVLGSRDFGAFVLATFFYIPFLALVCLCLLAASIFVKGAKNKLAMLATVPAIIVPSILIFFGQMYAGDRIRFELWHSFHRHMIEDFAGKDGIIIPWDSWGMAGTDNDSYLVSNPDDSISDLRAASTWVRRIQPDCSAADVLRMRRGLYIITTYNCPLR